MSFESIDALMRKATAEGIFPGGALFFSKSGRILFDEVYGYANIFDRRPVTRKTFFDLASLTKPLATAMAVLTLVQQGKITLDQTLGEIIGCFRNTPKDSIRIHHLLCHNSGLPAYQPYFKEIIHAASAEKKRMLQRFLIQEPLIYGIGAKTLYSDIGFMILEWVIETIVDMPIDQYLFQNLFYPLGIADLFYVKKDVSLSEMQFAATEVCPWRGRLIEGEVHDENAFVMGGVAGHAGLFGTAESVHRLLSLLMGVYRGEKRHPMLQQEPVRLFLTPRPDAQRALGFDIPSETDSSCGNWFEKKHTVGHLGFTGTSFWMDLHQSIIIVLLTNRIHPSRANEAIKKFRPMIHDAVMQAIIPAH
jgi:CubicO group peptidase (beta-lactamase class C family)